MEPPRIGAAHHVSTPSGFPEDSVQKLSDRLRNTLKPKHEEVSRFPFAERLTAGNVTITEYRRYLAALDIVYSQLEFQISEWSHVPCLQPFVREDIRVVYRKDALQPDLRFFDVKEGDIVPAAREFGKRIKELAETRPHLLIGHFYLRYLGDLFGGRNIGKNIGEKWPAGVAVYQYPTLEKTMVFVREFKTMLDSLPLDEREIDEIIEETSWGYDQNLKMFAEMQDRNAGEVTLS